MKAFGVVAGIFLALGLLWALLAYRAHFTSWPWQGEPYRIHYCERDYDRGAGYPGKTEARPGGYRPSFRSPPVVGRQVLIPVKARCGDGPVPIVVYRSAGDRRYRAYTLIGGP